MLKYLLLGMLAVIAAGPARSQPIELSCNMAPAEVQKMVAALGAGYADAGQQVMHLSVDKHTRKVTVWETSPEFPNASKSTYEAKFAGTTASWAIGDPEDGPQAHDSVQFEYERADDGLSGRRRHAVELLG